MGHFATSRLFEILDISKNIKMDCFIKILALERIFSRVNLNFLDVILSFYQNNFSRPHQNGSFEYGNELSGSITC
jgi:hypothetical protein